MALNNNNTSLLPPTILLAYKQPKQCISVTVNRYNYHFHVINGGIPQDSEPRALHYFFSIMIYSAPRQHSFILMLITVLFTLVATEWTILLDLIICRLLSKSLLEDCRKILDCDQKSKHTAYVLIHSFSFHYIIYISSDSLSF